MTPELNSITLPKAVGELFSINDHTVEYGVEINGAEVDLIARSSANPFTPTIYIEVTVERVNNDKYAKDLTKFAMLRQAEPQCVCISVTTADFTAPVRERAAKTNITLLTYDELFRKFEKFSPYITRILNEIDNKAFVAGYEEPLLSDHHGEQVATAWLNDWLTSSTKGRDWLIVLGEYGTGKTSLTRVLQYRWLQAYRADPSRPVPIRIELRSFTRQFDGRALLHHFLDSNGLTHIPVDFVIYLMRRGRIVLLLDGYDEMAQFLNFRERRACLAALAELSGFGAKGILTSRPNYFTEGEELKVFEALYDNINRSKIYVGQSDQEFLDAEIQVDSLIERYILERFERSLKDLSPQQTEALVARRLSTDPEGRAVVLALLRRVFREEVDGKRTALSGKPVIISYLLELIEDIKKTPDFGEDALSEWTIYKIIVDRLMLRDQQRATIPFDRRRSALQALAVSLSHRNTAVATDEDFLTLIDQDFRTDLRRLNPDERQLKRTQLFEDLRSSSTLTRAELAGVSGWMFSHNSLREFLCVEQAVSLLQGASAGLNVPITDAMRIFAASMPASLLDQCLVKVQAAWSSRHANSRLGKYLTMFWNALSTEEYRSRLVSLLSGDKGKLLLDGIVVSDLDIATIGSHPIYGRESEFSNVSFAEVDMRASDFRNAVFDNCTFHHSSFDGADFRGALLFECDLTDSVVRGGNFEGLDDSSTFYVRGAGGSTLVLTGSAAIGYLAFHGGATDDVDDHSRLRFHPGFAIIEKIADRLLNAKYSQYLGLTQKGESRADPKFARRFVDSMASDGFFVIDKNKNVSLALSGREMMGDLVDRNSLAIPIRDFLLRTV